MEINDSATLLISLEVDRIYKKEGEEEEAIITIQRPGGNCKRRDRASKMQALYGWSLE
jgi:hypothetical protein